MHQLVIARLKHNADYHEAIAEHYLALKTPQGAGTAPVSEAATPAPPLPPPPNAPPPPTANGGRRSQAPSARAETPAPERDRSEMLDKLIEMHSGAAQQLRDLIASEPPQMIEAARAKQPVRQTRPGRVRLH